MNTKELLVELKENVYKLLKEIQLRNQEIESLKDEIATLKHQLKESQKHLKVTENKNSELKVVSGLSGNKEHRRLMKLKLNSLIKEIDVCIADIKRQQV